MTPKQKYYETAANGIIEKLALRGMEGFYCKDREEAKKKAKEFLTKDCSVSWGGSETLNEIGLLEELKKDGNYQILDRQNPDPSLSAKEFYGKMVTSDVFFMSSNAITLDGELINIDGNGNRVACLCNGPDQVVLIVGINKIVPDVKAGIDRVRNMAAPPNAVRLDTTTPCKEHGRCMDCMKDDCMCCQIVVTRRSRKKGRINVILVGEELGY